MGELYIKVRVKRVRYRSDCAIDDDQFGFRRGTDQIFAVRQVSEKYHAKGMAVFWDVMDREWPTKRSTWRRWGKC